MRGCRGRRTAGGRRGRCEQLAARAEEAADDLVGGGATG